MRVEEVDDIFANIGSGHFIAKDALRQFSPPINRTAQCQTKKMTRKRLPMHAVLMANPCRDQRAYSGMAVHFARCCHLPPGDRIVGIVTTGKGVTIHTIDCETLETFADTPERWIDVPRGEGPDSPEAHVGRLK